MHRASPIARFTFGVVMLASLGSAGCGASTVIQCELSALRALPQDPKQATVADAIDVIQRVHACHQVQTDGGVP